MCSSGCSQYVNKAAPCLTYLTTVLRCCQCQRGLSVFAVPLYRNFMKLVWRVCLSLRLLQKCQIEFVVLSFIVDAWTGSKHKLFSVSSIQEFGNHVGDIQISGQEKVHPKRLAATDEWTKSKSNKRSSTNQSRLTFGKISFSTQNKTCIHFLQQHIHS